MNATPTDLNYLDTALSLAAAAGAVLLEGVGRAHRSESKSAATDLVTQYDRAAEEVIIRELRARYPDHRILAEEGGGDTAGGPVPPGVPRWIIDPLDGTTNFAHGLPFFAVSIACEVDGQARAGVVAAPALGYTFAAVAGGGATRNGRRIGISEVAALDRAILGTGFPYDRRTSPQNNFAQFVAFQLRVQAVRRIGAAALDLAMVACGWLDGFWEMKLSPWDLAAGVLIVREAGGQLSDWQGRAVDLQRGEVVASNGHIHGAMLEVLAQVPR